MRTLKRTPAHFTIIGTRIVDQFFDTLPLAIQQAWEGFLIKTITTKGTANKHMPWDKYNIRYGAQHSIPGCVSELIAIRSIQLHNKSTAFSLCESESEQKGGLDFIDLDTNDTYQVKSIRTRHNRVGLDSADTDISNPTADFLVLVDIDDCAVYCLPKSKFTQYTNEKTEVSFGSVTHGYSYVGWNCDTSDLAELSILPTPTIPFYTKPDINAVSTDDIESLW